MVQTNWVKAELEKAHQAAIQRWRPRATRSWMGRWPKSATRACSQRTEAQMLVGRAEIAVHSLKDLPTNLPEGLCWAASQNGKIPLTPWR